MNEPKILPVVVASITNGSDWLLIKRKRGDYIGYWALVGGKIKYNEELKEAVIREVKEETGLEGTVKGIKAIINEQLVVNNMTVRQFLLFFFEIEIKKDDSKISSDSSEGELKWFSPSELKTMRSKIIPSDYYMMSLILERKSRIEPIVSEIVMEQNEDGTLKLIKISEYS